MTLVTVIRLSEARPNLQGLLTLSSGRTTYTPCLPYNVCPGLDVEDCKLLAALSDVSSVMKASLVDVEGAPSYSRPASMFLQGLFQDPQVRGSAGDG